MAQATVACVWAVVAATCQAVAAAFAASCRPATICLVANIVDGSRASKSSSNVANPRRLPRQQQKSFKTSCWQVADNWPPLPLLWLSSSSFDGRRRRRRRWWQLKLSDVKLQIIIIIISFEGSSRSTSADSLRPSRLCQQCQPLGKQTRLGTNHLAYTMASSH